MEPKRTFYIVSTEQADVIAVVAWSSVLPALVTAALQEHWTLFVDATNWEDDGGQASWFVEIDTDLGYPEWTRLSGEDTAKRSGFAEAQIARVAS